MVPINRRKVSLYEEAKNGLSSLVWQTATVFVGFIFMLLLTGGNPSGFAITLSFVLGIAFVAWREQERITKLREVGSENYLNKSKDLTKHRQRKIQQWSELAAEAVRIHRETTRLSQNSAVASAAEALKINQFDNVDADKKIVLMHLSELHELIAIDNNLTDEERDDAIEHLNALHQIALKDRSSNQQVSQAKA